MRAVFRPYHPVRDSLNRKSRQVKVIDVNKNNVLCHVQIVCNLHRTVFEKTDKIKPEFDANFQ
jgi:hypothetical protein